MTIRRVCQIGMTGTVLLLLSCGENELHALSDSGDTGEEATGDNTPPSAPIVRISPSAPTPDEDLFCEIVQDSADPESNPLTYAYSWEVDSSVVDVNTQEVSSNQTAHGELWTCIITTSEGLSGKDSVEVVQPNRAPESPVVAISPEIPGTNHTLQCLIIEPSTDLDGDEVSYLYEWSVDGAASDKATDTVSSKQTAEGEKWTCTVKPTDGELSGDKGSDSVTIGVAVYGTDITSGLVYDASDCSYCPDNDWYIPDKAFDDSLGTGAESWDVFWTDGEPEWISVDFGIGNERTITRYGLMGSAFHEGYRAKDWQLQGSDDEKIWDELHTVNGAELIYVMYGGEAFTYYSFFNETAYRYYRLYVTANMGGQPYNNALNIVEIEMMENEAAE